MLNIFLDGYQAKITTKKWAELAECSKDTALRDIQSLVNNNILREDIPGAKRPSYSIVYDHEDLSLLFTNVTIENKDKTNYIKAIYKGKEVKERIFSLDADRYNKGELPLNNLLGKYFAYLLDS